MEIFPHWGPNLNKKHFPRSADSEWVAVAAGQLPDGTIVPIQTVLIDGTTDQYALTVNTEITMPPITIGKVVVQGTDKQGLKEDVLATQNPDGTWNLAVEDLNLETLMRLQISTTANGITLILGSIQSSTASLQDGITDLKIELLEGLTNIVTLEAQQVDQLSQIIFNTSNTTSAQASQQITQLSTLQFYAAQQITQLSDIPNLNQEVTQLSILQAMSGLSVTIGEVIVNTDALEELSRIQTATIAEGFTEVLVDLAQQIIQLSSLESLASQQVTQLSDIPSLNQEVTQLSILQAMGGLSVTIGDVIVNTDELELLTRIQTDTIAGGLTNIFALESQQITQLSDLQVRVSTEVTQLSILQQIQGLTFDSPSLAQETTQLSILQELEGLCVNINSDSLAQEVTQLSILYELEGLCVNIDSATLNQEVTQLSVLQVLEGLSVTVDTAGLNQEVTQLSVLQAVEGLSITQAPPHGQYYVFEGTQTTGLTDVTYDFGGLRMEDVYITSSAPIGVKFQAITSPVINLLRGVFSFTNQNAYRMYVTTNGAAANLQIYANGGF